MSEHSAPLLPKVGKIVFLALYSSAGVSPARVSRYKFDANHKITGIFITEKSSKEASETYLPLSRLGELIFLSFQDANEELERRKRVNTA